MCLGATFLVLAMLRVSSLLARRRGSYFFFFFFYVSRVTDALVYFKHKQKRKRERERKLWVSFDDDLLIYVVLHKTITVFYAYTRRRGIDALLSRRCVVTRGFSHSFPLARSDDVVTQHRHHYSLSISHTPRSSLLLLTR